MNRVILDADLRSKLGDLSEPLELCDESGRVLGRLFPSVDLSAYEPWEPPIDEQELQRREQSTEWYTTPQVIERLKER
jgi:hypothetical protein